MFSDQLEDTAKGILYAREPWRLNLIDDRQAIFQGRHRNHALLYIDGIWHCDCAAWERQVRARFDPRCCHTNALIRILTAMDEGTALVCQGELLR